MTTLIDEVLALSTKREKMSYLTRNLYDPEDVLKFIGSLEFGYKKGVMNEEVLVINPVDYGIQLASIFLPLSIDGMIKQGSDCRTRNELLYDILTANRYYCQFHLVIDEKQVYVPVIDGNNEGEHTALLVKENGNYTFCDPSPPYESKGVAHKSICPMRKEDYLPGMLPIYDIILSSKKVGDLWYISGVKVDKKSVVLNTFTDETENRHFLTEGFKINDLNAFIKYQNSISVDEAIKQPDKVLDELTQEGIILRGWGAARFDLIDGRGKVTPITEVNQEVEKYQDNNHDAVVKLLFLLPFAVQPTQEQKSINSKKRLGNSGYMYKLNLS